MKAGIPSADTPTSMLSIRSPNILWQSRDWSERVSGLALGCWVLGGGEEGVRDMLCLLVVCNSRSWWIAGKTTVKSDESTLVRP